MLCIFGYFLLCNALCMHLSKCIFAWPSLIKIYNNHSKLMFWIINYCIYWGKCYPYWNSLRVVDFRQNIIAWIASFMVAFTSFSGNRHIKLVAYFYYYFYPTNKFSSVPQSISNRQVINAVSVKLLLILKMIWHHPFYIWSPIPPSLICIFSFTSG